MFKGLSNFASIVKQAQQVGGKMQEVSSRLKKERVKGTAGGGLVEVEANGLGEVLRVRIDAALDDREMLEDLLPGAINQAAEKARQLNLELMTDGLDMSALGDVISQMTSESPDNGPH